MAERLGDTTGIWKKIAASHRKWAEDEAFFAWVVRHMGALGSAADYDEIAAHTVKRCPAGRTATCKRLGSAAKEAARECRNAEKENEWQPSE